MDGLFRHASRTLFVGDATVCRSNAICLVNGLLGSYDPHSTGRERQTVPPIAAVTARPAGPDRSQGGKPHRPRNLLPHSSHQKDPFQETVTADRVERQIARKDVVDGLESLPHPRVPAMADGGFRFAGGASIAAMSRVRGATCNP